MPDSWVVTPDGVRAQNGLCRRAYPDLYGGLPYVRTCVCMHTGQVCWYYARVSYMDGAVLHASSTSLARASSIIDAMRIQRGACCDRRDAKSSFQFLSRPSCSRAQSPPKTHRGMQGEIFSRSCGNLISLHWHQLVQQSPRFFGHLFILWCWLSKMVPSLVRRQKKPASVAYYCWKLCSRH